MDHESLSALVRGGAKESEGGRAAREELEDLHLQVFGQGSGARLLAIWLESVDGSVFESGAGERPLDGMSMAILAAQRDGRRQFVRSIRQRMEKARRRHERGNQSA